jgi:hypothetical protein
VRIRHKRDESGTFPVIDESQLFYVVGDGELGDSYTHALPKADWEPVPTETWRDVTGECDMVDQPAKDCYPYSQIFEHEGRGFLKVGKGYRLRKVDLNHGIERVGRDYAFIVEKREP